MCKLMISRSDRQLWHRFWEVAKFYWFSQEKWGARVLLLLIFLLSLASSSFLVIDSLQRGEIVSSLAAKDTDRFLKAIWFFLGLIIIGIPILSFNAYIQGRLSLYWRRWLTHYFLNQYLDEQAFYQISSQTEIDNPDQRIAEDIKTFTQQSLYFFGVFLDAVFQMIGFIAVLWTISKPLMGFLIIYAFIGTVFTFVIFGKVLTRINFEQFKREADFRFGLIRLRENAEAIAFYRGQFQESNQVKERFIQVFSNFRRLIGWQFNLNVFQNGYLYFNFILPFIVLAPRIFSGDLEIGAVVQSQAAFERIGFSLGIVINQFDKLSQIAAGINRLGTLAQALKIQTHSRLLGYSTIDTRENFDLALQHLTLQTPDYQTTLVKDLSVSIPEGGSLLIMGESGVGKSSLLRSIAGLWNSGSGVIIRPKREQMLFLPQRPYMVLGSLRYQLLYPNHQQDVDAQRLHQLLQQVNLAHLISRYGTLDNVEDWSRILSLGEQQRLAFARLLLAQPKYAILDEATSALDLDNEELLYQQLQESSITFVSVGHRSILLKYHQQVLVLTQEQSWCLSSAASYGRCQE